MPLVLALARGSRWCSVGAQYQCRQPSGCTDLETILHAMGTAPATPAPRFQDRREPGGCAMPVRFLLLTTAAAALVWMAATPLAGPQHRLGFPVQRCVLRRCVHVSERPQLCPSL